MRNFAATALALTSLASQQAEARLPENHTKMTLKRFQEEITDSSSGLTHEICTRSVDRMLHENVNPNDLFRESMSDPTFKWTDPTFSGVETLNWSDNPMYNSLEWLTDSYDESENSVRISEMFEYGYSLFGKTDISVHDPIQGKLGNCWIHAAASVVALDPQRIKDIFLTDTLNTAGVYSLNMYMMGIPTTVTVDDFLPASGNYPIFADGNWDGALWMPILEKAAAKLYGNYMMLEGGWMGPAVQALTGAPYFVKYHGDYTADELWEDLNDKFQRNWMITSASHFGAGGDQFANDLGLPYSHAYTILGVHELSDSTRLIKVRNPWGREKYQGPWSDYDEDNLTDEIMAELGHESRQDGVWFMDAKTYHENMQMTHVNPDVQSEHMTYWAAFDVVANEEHTEKFEITSDTDQMVYISAYTYNSQHIQNNACMYKSEGVSLVLRHEYDEEEYDVFRGGGQGHAAGYQMSTGQTMWVEIDVSFPEEDILAHDFSLVIQAEKSAVILTKDAHNHEEAVFPYYSKLDDDVIIQEFEFPNPDDAPEPTPTPEPTPIPDEDEDDDVVEDEDVVDEDEDEDEEDEVLDLGYRRIVVDGKSFHDQWEYDDGQEETTGKNSLDAQITMTTTRNFLTSTSLTGITVITVDGTEYDVTWTLDYEFGNDSGRLGSGIATATSKCTGNSQEWTTDYRVGLDGEFESDLAWEHMGWNIEAGQFIYFRVESDFNQKFNVDDWPYKADNEDWPEGADMVLQFWISQYKVNYNTYINFETGVITNDFYVMDDRDYMISQSVWKTGMGGEPGMSLLGKHTGEEPAKSAEHENISDYTMGGIVAASAICVAVAAYCVVRRKRDAVNDDYIRA